MCLLERLIRDVLTGTAAGAANVWDDGGNGKEAQRNEGKAEWKGSSGERRRETELQRMMSEGEERGGKFKEILLIKRESTTRGDGINQSFALMRHLLIMPGREVVVGGLGGGRRKESAGL